MSQESFLALRKQIIRKDYADMNDRQFEAITTANGPVLVLAGAGSGKTTVLVNRIAYLVTYGNAYNSTDVSFYAPADEAAGEAYLQGGSGDFNRSAFAVDPVAPWNILAITFTNKAAGELKDRIAARLGSDADDLWAGTFHAVCGKMLRRFAQRLGYTSHFTIYDTDDQKRLMKEILKSQYLDEKIFSPKSVLAEISSAKDKMLTPEAYKASVPGDYRVGKIAALYQAYDKRLKEADAMDFDDMIVNMVRLLEQERDVLEYYHNKFRYVMVDEYQDTNYAQYRLVKLLAGGYNNICVVGDDDQSIYRFRGATIENILNFESQYTDCRTIRLEQNYRSTTYILDAANAVIANNRGRKGKTLWTDMGQGTPIQVYTATDQQDEARFVANQILTGIAGGDKYADHAVLYRINAQSNVIENVFSRSGIPYQVIGGLRFFDRKEVKDVLAYLQLINNCHDDLRLKRIINEPKRGIGDTTVNRAADIAASLGLSLFEVFQTADEYAPLMRSAGKLKEFTAMITDLQRLSEEISFSELLGEVLERSGYQAALRLEGDEGLERLENVKELTTNIMQYEQENSDASLAGFLEEVALVSDLDNYDSSADRVVMMTVHSAKGLEFSHVYLVGWEEGIFPGNQSIMGGETEIEEERRLAYVAITRAKQNLFISNTYIRMLYGSTNRNMPSRFLKEIPQDLCVFSGQKPPATAYGFDDLYGGGFEWHGDRSSRNGNRPSAYGNGTDRMPQAEPTPSLRPVNLKTQLPAYSVGMRVTHPTFGEGTIQKITPVGSDVLLEVVFDSVGLKKLMATYAKLKIIS